MLADIFPSTIDELVEDAKCRMTRVENALSGPPSDAVRQPIITVSSTFRLAAITTGILLIVILDTYRTLHPYNLPDIHFGAPAALS